jgi:hypothetical protein
MAGKRRRDGKPLLRQVKADRRMTQLLTELGAADGPSRRLAVAVDYVKAALTSESSPATAGQVQVLLQELVTAADRVWLSRRHAALQAAMAQAPTMGDQLGLARDYLRNALSRDPITPENASAAAKTVEDLVRSLLATGDRIHAGRTGGAR